jgi:pimeloyl-ACP methyl ester carboxylesterase
MHIRRRTLRFYLDCSRRLYEPRPGRDGGEYGWGGQMKAAKYRGARDDYSCLAWRSLGCGESWGGVERTGVSDVLGWGRALGWG